MLNDRVLAWIKQLCEEYFVVICVGGGTQINEAFQKAGLPVREFGPLGRPTDTLEEKQVARDVLEQNQMSIQDRLADLRIHASVVIPTIDVGTVFCHVNGDQYTLAAYHGFDVLYVVTTTDRVQKKEEQFSPYAKIHVIGF
jgi:acetylglutamate kinase